MHDLNDAQNDQKKYKVSDVFDGYFHSYFVLVQLMKAHSKQQQLLLDQLEAHVQFYE